MDTDISTKKNIWTTARLRDVLDYEQPTNYVVQSDQYDDTYNTPVLTAGKSFLLGYTNESGGIFPTGKLPVIIFDDFTTASKFVDFPFKVKSSAMKILTPKKGVEIKFIFYIMNRIRFSIHSHKRYWISEYSDLPILLPPLPEQKSIASLLETWDTAIEKTETLIAAKQKQFEWLATSLINQSGHKMSRLLNFVEEVSIRNQNNNLNRVLSVTNHSGFVLPEEQFERRIASINVSNYKIVKRDQYAYNPARINVGSIARLDNWDNGIISPMYIVFRLNPKKIENDYFLYWLSSGEAKQRIRNSEQGSVRKTVSFDNLRIIPIALPNIKTQKMITKTLNTSQQEITLLKQLAEQYRVQKRGLIQRLLTGEWRTIRPNKITAQ